VSGGFVIPDDQGADWQDEYGLEGWDGDWDNVPLAQYWSGTNQVTNNAVFQGGAPAFNAVSAEMQSTLFGEYSFGDGLSPRTLVTGMADQLQDYIDANESLRGTTLSGSIPVLFQLYGDFVSGLHWQGLLSTDFSTNTAPKLIVEYRPVVTTFSALGSGTSTYALEGASTGKSFQIDTFINGQETNLTNGSSTDNFPAWSPDGTKIAFQSSRDSGYEIYVMNATDGSSVTRITDNTANSVEPTWSPDGTRVAFSRSYDIFSANSDGSGSETNITNRENGVDSFLEPSWSPDGLKIACRSIESSGWEIAVVDVDDGDRTALTSGDGTEYDPAWSPDGTEIAFVRSGSIYVMDSSDGSSQTILTNSGYAPTWSPDGSQIAFLRSNEIFVMDNNGDNVTQITDSAGANVEPAWSPDGNNIAFRSSRDSNYEIYTISKRYISSYSVSGSGTSTYSIEGEATSVEALIGDSISTIALEGGT
jgi:TolB protein